MLSLRKNFVSVLFFNQLSQDISHTILSEQEDVFQQLMNGNYDVDRQGADVFLQITSETELLNLRQITSLPLFIKF